MAPLTHSCGNTICLGTKMSVDSTEPAFLTRPAASSMPNTLSLYINSTTWSRVQMGERMYEPEKRPSSSRLARSALPRTQASTTYGTYRPSRAGSYRAVNCTASSDCSLSSDLATVRAERPVWRATDSILRRGSSSRASITSRSVRVSPVPEVGPPASRVVRTRTSSPSASEARCVLETAVPSTTMPRTVTPPTHGTV